MGSIAQQGTFIKASLFQFITKYLPAADLNVIDDIVLSYVISILEEASEDPCFDVEGFIEMMAAYVPDFASIDAGVVCSWVLDLETELTRRIHEEAIANANGNDINVIDKYFSGEPRGDKITLTLHALTEMLPSVTKNRSHSNSESSDEGNRRPLFDSEEYAGQCRILHEMFPNTCSMEIKHCVTIARGDAQRAAATLLHRREQGQALSTAALHAAARTKLCNDEELKNRIIARYSYVDKNRATKEHKPLAPKIEPKKLVRYRDNKIVSLRGERYTEVPKSGADEENLKKPKKQHSP